MPWILKGAGNIKATENANKADERFSEHQLRKKATENRCNY